MNDFVSRRDFLGVLGAASLLPRPAAGQVFPADSVPVTSRELWSWMRAQLVLEPGLAWLDTAGSGPALRAVTAREFRSRERQSENLLAYEAVALGPAMTERLARIAAFIGVAPDDVALTSGSAEAINIVARGLDLQPGDEVLTTGHDRPAAVQPWLLEARRRGIKVVQLPQDGLPGTPEAIVGRFAAAITPRTRVMTFAHVQDSDGTVMPVRELCALARSNGIFSLVDGAQGPGHLDLRLAEFGCDAYATSFHRWLNAPRGTGALVLGREARERVWPLVVDQPTDGRSAQDRYGRLARYHAPSLEGIAIAIEFRQVVNPARIGARIRELAAYLRAALGALAGVEIVSPAHPALASGIVSFRVAARDHAALVESLAREDRIAVAHVARGTAFDAIRASLHASNDHDEIERLVNALRRRL
ncbi:MAG: aminotransferase class V-fold PLP-dependent enzyme [Steroidobacteraceae bacterium]